MRRFWADFAAAVPEPSWRAGGPLEALALPAGPIVMRETLAEHGVACADETAAALWEALNAIPESAFNNHLFPDAAATVGALASAGYRLAVVTTRPDSPAALAWRLREMGLPDVFEAVVTGGEVGYRKPHPLVFESALRRLGVQAAQAVFVGDNYEHDIVPAASLGMAAVLKLNERAPDARWERARHQVGSLTELLELELLRLPATRNPG